MPSQSGATARTSRQEDPSQPCINILSAKQQDLQALCLEPSASLQHTMLSAFSRVHFGDSCLFCPSMSSAVLELSISTHFRDLISCSRASSVLWIAPSRPWDARRLKGLALIRSRGGKQIPQLACRERPSRINHSLRTTRVVPLLHPSPAPPLCPVTCLSATQTCSPALPAHALPTCTPSPAAAPLTANVEHSEAKKLLPDKD